MARPPRLPPGVTLARVLEAVVISPGKAPRWYQQVLSQRPQQIRSAAERMRKLELLRQEGASLSSTWSPTTTGLHLAHQADDLVGFFTFASRHPNTPGPDLVTAYLARQPLDLPEVELETPTVKCAPDVRPAPGSVPSQFIDEPLATFPALDIPNLDLLLAELLDNLKVRKDLPLELRLAYACGITSRKEAP